MAHNIASWLLASGLVALGMDWKQAVFTIALANLIVLGPMLLTGHAGPKCGIPFPVLARASFGLRGANLPALIRAAVACARFGIPTWIGGVGIFTWLGLVGGLPGTVAGILIADYWIVRRTVLDFADLYRPGGRYWYAGGWNWRAVTAFAVGGVPAIGGSHSEPGKGPFPSDGLVPFLKPLADYGWAVGLVSSLVLYALLMGREGVTAGRTTGSAGR